MQLNEFGNDNDEGISEIEATKEIKFMPQTQGHIFSVIEEHGYVNPYGALDVSDVMEHVNSKKAYVFQSFGKNGRVAHYTNEVDHPTVEVVTDSYSDVSSHILSLIEKHGQVNPDGTIDHEVIYNLLDDDVPSSRKQIVDRVIGEHCRVLVPLRDHPDNQLGMDTDDTMVHANTSTNTNTSGGNHHGTNSGIVSTEALHEQHREIENKDTLPQSTANDGNDTVTIPTTLSDDVVDAYMMGWKRRGQWEKQITE